MKITLLETIDLNQNQIRLLRILNRQRVMWQDNNVGQVLDSLSGYGLVSYTGEGLFSLTTRGNIVWQEYLNQAE